MDKQLEAVFEHGVLRPLEPISLPENSRVLLSIGPVIPAKLNTSREAEMRWLKNHAVEYSGEWVALSGDQLLSSGFDARTVHSEAVRKGVGRPLMVHLPDGPHQHSVGWL